MTVVIFFQTNDALVALADGWTHHSERSQEDRFDTRKLYRVLDESGETLCVVGTAGRANFGTDSVESALVKHRALLQPPTGVPVTTGALARRLALLFGDLAEQNPRDDCGHRLDLLVGGFRRDQEGEEGPGWYLVQIDGDGDGLEACQAPKGTARRGDVSVHPETWYWDAVGSCKVAELVVDSLRDTTLTQDATYLVGQLKKNLSELAEQHADTFADEKVGGRCLIWTVSPGRFEEESLQLP